MKTQTCCVQTQACRISLLSGQEEKENKGAVARKIRKGRIANQEQKFIILRWFSKATSTSVTASAAVKQAFAAVTVMNGSPCVYWNMVHLTSCLISLSNLYFTHSSGTFKSSAWLLSYNLWLHRFRSGWCVGCFQESRLPDNRARVGLQSDHFSVQSSQKIENQRRKKKKLFLKITVKKMLRALYWAMLKYI